MEELVGRTLGRYEVTALVGRGGMATVYKARQSSLNRTVAVKVLHRHLAVDSAFVGRFRREARAVAALRHPNIVRVHDFDNEGDIYFIVMEFIDGPTLASFLKRLFKQGRHLSPQEILRLFSPLCSAIDYAHQQGMVHRDIKPSNIILTRQHEPVLTDYGIARIAGATAYTLPGVVIGSAHYMSPEQAEGLPGDSRSDIYSLGIVLFEALTGSVPFQGETPMSVVIKQVSATPPPALSLNPDLPPAIEAVFSRTLAKDPNDRYQHGSDLLLALQEVFGKAAAEAAAAVEAAAGEEPTVQVTRQMTPPPPSVAELTRVAEPSAEAAAAVEAAAAEEPTVRVTREMALAPPSATTSYAVQFEIESADHLSRRLALVKWLLALPHWLVLYVLWVGQVLTSLAAAGCILITGRYPFRLFGFCVGSQRWLVNVLAYSLAFRDEYPPFSWKSERYPAVFDLRYPEKLSRVGVLIKLFGWSICAAWVLRLMRELGPAFVFVLMGLWLVPWLVGLVAVLIYGRYPLPARRLVLTTIRLYLQLYSFLTFLTDEYNPFSRAPSAITSYAVQFEIESADHLSRRLALVKWLLALPHWLVLCVLWVGQVLTSLAAAGCILITGRYPFRLFGFCVGSQRWLVNVLAYSLFFRDEYPPFSWKSERYPAVFDLRYPEKLSRVGVLIKLFGWFVYAFLLVFVLWWLWLVPWLVGLVAVLIYGRYPPLARRLVLTTIRVYLQLYSFLTFLTDEYNPFSREAMPAGEEPTGRAGAPLPAA